MSDNRDLVLLNRARKTMAEVKTVGQAIEIRDYGHAAVKWAKARRDVSIDVVNDGMEVVLRMERFIGSELAEASPGRGGDRKSSNSELLDLEGMGISKMQSSRWQSEARVPDEDFERFVLETKEAGKQLTSGALVKLGKQQSHRRQWAEPQEPIEGICTSLQDLIDDGKRFRCLYADPPWAYGNQETRASTDNHYGTMSVADICALPVAQVAGDNAHLHLWTTNGFLFDAHQVIEAWGFEYRSCFVWVKPQMGIGNYWRVSHEFLLLGIRGQATNFLANDERSWQELDRTGHSRKPYDVRRRVERVSPGPYLELFGREAVPGWTVFGNQIEQGGLL